MVSHLGHHDAVKKANPESTQKFRLSNPGLMDLKYINWIFLNSYSLLKSQNGIGHGLYEKILTVVKYSWSNDHFHAH